MLLTRKVLLCLLGVASAVALARSQADKCPLTVDYLLSKAPGPAVANVKDKCQSPQDKAFCESCYCSVSYTGAMTFGQQLSNMSAPEAQACGLSLSMALVQLGALNLTSAAALSEQCSGATIQWIVSSNVCQKYLPTAAVQTAETPTQTVGPAVSGPDPSSVTVPSNPAANNTATLPTASVVAPLATAVVPDPSTNSSAIQQTAVSAGTVTVPAVNDTMPVAAASVPSANSTAAAEVRRQSVPTALAAVSSTTPNQAGAKPAVKQTPSAAAPKTTNSSSSTPRDHPSVSTNKNTTAAPAVPKRGVGPMAPDQHQRVAATAAVNTKVATSCPFSIDDISKSNLTAVKAACDVTRLQRREFCSACACALSKVQEASTANQTSTASTAAAHSNATAGRSQESAVAGADAQDTAAVAAPAACESEVVAAVTRAGVITGEAADMLNSDMCRYVPVAEKEAACSVASASAAVRSEGVQVAAATSMVLTVLVVMSAWLML